MTRLNILNILAIFLLSCKVIFGASDKFTDINIAIVDFEAVGITANEASVATDKFRYQLLENSSYKIMERAMMEELLKEQGFQQTGACNSASCLVETGQLLGVHYLVAGKVSRADNMIAFSARLIDVKTGEIVLAITKESENRFSAFVTTDIPVYTNAFIQKIKSHFEQTSKTTQTGLLYIESDPISGEVYLDEEQTGKTTPVTFSNVKPGKHTIRIVVKEFVGYENVLITAGQLAKVSVKLQKGISSVLISTTPGNADVMIDGNYIGKSPLTKDSIDAGTHSVTIKMQGYEPIKETLFFSASQRMDKTFILTPIGYLKLIDVKQNMKVLVDWVPFDVSGDGVFKLSTGTHKIKVTAQGYEDGYFEITARQSDTTILAPKLAPLKGSVHIESYPANATIKISSENGFSKMAVAPITGLRLEPGTYSLEYSSRKYLTISKTINITPGATLQIIDTLLHFTQDYIEWQKRKDAFKNYNYIEAGLGDLLIEKSPQGVFLLSAGVISDVFVGISAYQFITHFKRVKAATTDVERYYYKGRQTEDQYWLIGTVVTSALLRFICYEISNQRTF